MLHAADKNWKVEVFYDGDCPLCRREIEFLRRRDSSNFIRFSDLSHQDFEAESTGKSMEELMARIHGRLPDGTIIEGVEVFRRLYSAIGFNGAVAFSRWPVVRQALDLSYRVFVRYRLLLTGRRGERCSSKTCRVD